MADAVLSVGFRKMVGMILGMKVRGASFTHE